MFDKKKVLWLKPGDEISTPIGMKYIIGKPISSGAYALIFEGTDLFGNSVVLKVFKPAKRTFISVKKQWEKECGIFEITRHPNVVAIYDSFICENLCYIVLERAWGDLYHWIEINKPLNEAIVREMARQLLFAIHYIHTKGIVQRDINIFNILVFEGKKSNPIYKITDFGISKDLIQPWQSDDDRTEIANPLFIPPELIISQYGYTNQQSDLYHLGLILLYAITGTPPFDNKKSLEDIKKEVLIGEPRKEAEKIKTSLGDFISILLRRRQEYRFKSAIDTSYFPQLCNRF